jgi:hypothetical protein
MSHPWQRLLVFINFRLHPKFLLSIEDVNIVNYPLFVVALSASKHNKILAKLRGRVTVSGRRGAAMNLKVSKIFKFLP